MAKLPHDQLNLKFIELIALGEGLVKAALFGSVMAALLYVGVWVPLIQKSLTEPLSLLARHMNELASGNTDVKIDVSELSVELGGIAQSLETLRDAIKRNNVLMVEIRPEMIAKPAFCEMPASERM